LDESTVLLSMCKEKIASIEHVFAYYRFE
jgi:hypothetical protein